MKISRIAPRQEWLAERLDLLAKEKAGEPGSWRRWPNSAALAGGAGRQGLRVRGH